MFAWDNQRAFGFEHFRTKFCDETGRFSNQSHKKIAPSGLWIFNGYAPNSRLSRETAVWRLLTVKRLNHFIGQLFQTAVV